MKIKLKVWRQPNNTTKGEFKIYEVDNVLEDISFFEMLDMLNNSLIQNNESPISFDHDCREGICGTCGVIINGRAHGPLKGVTTCQLHMRSFKTGGAPDANAMPIFKENADEAFDSATCIGCGACVAVCKNSSAMLFVGAKVNQYAQLPQGQVEHAKRVKDMVAQMDDEGFGCCTNTGACEADCPKEISISNIVKLNKEYIKSGLN